MKRTIITAALALALALPAASASAQTHCQRRYQDLGVPIYDRLVKVFERRHLSCFVATRIGSAVADAYERGLPRADYPPPIAPGFPGGHSRRFKVRTRSYGTYTCRMLERGSDFVEAKCWRGVRYVRFVSLNHWSVHR